MSEQTVYGGASVPTVSRTKIRTHHLLKWKSEGHKWAMLTVYDYSTARAFDEAGIPVLLVGDSAANVVYGYDTTVPISVDELIPWFAVSSAAPSTRWSSLTSRSVPMKRGPSKRCGPQPGS